MIIACVTWLCDASHHPVDLRPGISRQNLLLPLLHSYEGRGGINLSSSVDSNPIHLAAWDNFSSTKILWHETKSQFKHLFARVSSKKTIKNFCDAKVLSMNVNLMTYFSGHYLQIFTNRFDNVIKIHFLITLTALRHSHWIAKKKNSKWFYMKFCA